jgi:hypothetical protein
MIIVNKKLTKEDVKVARENYSEYIKITVDLEKEIVVIGGEYHADAENILVEKFNSKRSNIWGGGYNITLDKFEVNALVNLKPGTNDSMDILNPETRNHFLKLVEKNLDGIQSLI